MLADVSEHNSNPTGENELRFVVGTCVFLLLAWFGIPACFCLSYIVGKNVDADCWFLGRNVDAAVAKEEIILSPSSPKKKISKPSDKTSSTTGSSATMFLVDMIWTQTPAHWHLKIPIKWYGSIYFVSLVEKKCSSICPEKATENSIQMVNAQRLWSWSLRISLSCWLSTWQLSKMSFSFDQSHSQRYLIHTIIWLVEQLKYPPIRNDGQKLMAWKWGSQRSRPYAFFSRLSALRANKKMKEAVYVAKLAKKE